MYEVDADIVRQAAQEVLPKTPTPWSIRNLIGWLFTITAASLAVVLLMRLSANNEVQVRNEPPTSLEIPADATGPVPATEQDPILTPLGEAAAEDLKISRPPIPAGSLQRSTYAALFKAWGVPYDSDESVAPCEFAQRVKLLCGSRSGTWADIALLDLPVILELQDGEGAPYFAAMTRGNSTRMTLVVGTQTLQVSAEDLKTLWFGNFSFFWPQPPLHQDLLQKGDLQDGVAILRDRLERALGRPISYTISNLFDEELAKALTEFQKREALPLEAVAGPMTWVRLTRVNASRPLPSLREPDPPS